MATYDFIIVGAGPAGCTLASRLSRSSKRPSVLLVEAGAANDSRDLRVDGERWLTMMNEHMNYKYETVPQNELLGRPIPYDRGKGLGGSSAINFVVYNVGAADDYEEIALRTGDPDWKWKAIQQRFKDLESYHGDDAGEALQRYLHPRPMDHGTNGLLNIGFPSKSENSLSHMLDICEESGHPLNPDVNSGHPIGFGVCPGSAYRGLRSTAADLLKDAPSNLKLMRDTQIRRVVIEDNIATGIETMNGEYLHASKEVILCAGSIDTPKLLMLSGIGPAEDLKKLDINVAQDLPMVGKGLKDHNHAYMLWSRKPETSERPQFYRDPEAILKAKEQWKFDGSGPLAEYGVSLGVGYLKSEEVYKSAEFNALPPATQEYLQRPSVPTFEILMNAPDLRDLISPTTSSASSAFFIFLLNPQSTGHLTLSSSNPRDPPIIDPEFFTHSYDRRVVIEAIKKLLELTEQPSFKKDTLGPVDAPNSASDEDILEFWRQKAASTWHPSCTVQIDSTVTPSACLDTSLRVHGIQNLRVGDLSVLPLLPNCHTQSVAYVVGATLGDKLSREYGLNGK